MAVGTTFDHSITRDELIALAYRKVGALPEGQPLSGTMHQDGLMELGLLVRELSDDEIYLHAQETNTLTLQANVFQYTIANGLPARISQLDTVKYRSPSGLDLPVEILSRSQYEAISNKFLTGEPCSVFLSDEVQVSARTLSIWPAPSTVTAQSVVTGTDAGPYRCIRSHAGDSLSRPITGANWRLFWESGGSGPATWVSGTAYTAPALLRISSLRPLFDFDAATDNPDLPASQASALLYILMSRLGVGYLTLPELERHEATGYSALARVFRRTMVKRTTKLHNNALYF